MNILQVQNVTKSYGDHTLFAQLNFAVEQGEMVAFMGKSGVGKTTLLNIIGLIEKPTSGEVKYFDKVVSFRNKKQIQSYLRTKIGFLFQNFALLEDETVAENFKVVFNTKLSKKSREDKIAHALKKVGIVNSLDKKVSLLSGGEQQRVAIARLLLKECDVILADEPTGNLDKENRDIVLKLLLQMKEEGKTLILVTHDPFVAEACDRVIDL